MSPRHVVLRFRPGNLCDSLVPSICKPSRSTFMLLLYFKMSKHLSILRSIPSRFNCTPQNLAPQNNGRPRLWPPRCHFNRPPNYTMDCHLMGPSESDPPLGLTSLLLPHWSTPSICPCLPNFKGRTCLNSNGRHSFQHFTAFSN